jgi:fatty-acyl-CoA synthase
VATGNARRKRLTPFETIRDGWLYTGDLARVDEEGYIYIVDREKDMYVSGGENVYPAEIEKVLHTHPKIIDVGVLGVPDEKWGEVGRAFIVLKPGDDEHCGDLRTSKEKWPNKIPKSAEIIEELPKTASGKIQKFLKELHKAKYSNESEFRVVNI